METDPEAVARMRLKGILLSGILVLAAGCCSDSQVSRRPRELLLGVMAAGEGWSRIHAAEGLLDGGRDREEIVAEFRKELAESRPDTPWRVGVLRVLYRADPARRPLYRRELGHYAVNPASPAAVHAVETLGKLAVKLTVAERKRFRRYCRTEGLLGDYSVMALAANRDPAAGRRLLARLRQRNATAAFACYYLPELPAGVLPELIAAAAAESTDSRCRAYCLKALCRHRREAGTNHAQLIAVLKAEPAPGVLVILLQAVGEFGRPADRPRLRQYLLHDDPAVRLAAAAALLRLPGE